jgi:uncharacterized protein
LRAVGWLAAAAVGSLVVAAVAFGLLGAEEASPAVDLVLACVVVLGLSAVPLAIGWRSSTGWRTTFGFVVSRRAVRVGLVGALASLLVTVAVTEGVRALTGVQSTSSTSDTANSFGSPLLLGLFLVVAVVGATFSEEIAFRGLVWGAVSNRWRSPWVASVASALPFALIHIEPTRALPLFCSGVVLGVVRQEGGLAAAMLAHACVNMVPAIALVVLL